MIAIEATIFTGRIYDHEFPHAEEVKVALMLRVIAAAKTEERLRQRGQAVCGRAGELQLPRRTS
jgi:hypothetical protein